MRIFQKLALAATLFLTAQVQAFTPESGIWWNPNESGSGYAIEIQDNFLFVALYVYDVDGNPTWYTAGTTMEGNALFNGDLHYTYNGPCIDCNYTAPITILGQRGPITINFQTESTATIQFEGAVKNIERFNFLLGDETDKMLGEWQTIIDFSSVGQGYPFSADVLLFDLITTDNGKFAEGCRPDNTIDGFCTDFALNNHDMAATFDYGNNELLVVVNEDEDYWLAYYLKVGLDHFRGEAELYPKNAGHNNIFYPVRGFRTASRSFIETGVGPSKSAQTSSKLNIGITHNFKSKLPSKSIESFSQEEQVKIIKRQALIQKLINKLEAK
jgi:hypothetical protein